MGRPKVFVTKQNRGTSYMFELSLGGSDPGWEVQQEFVAISSKHSLVATGGGCFEVMANTLPHGTVHYLGGIYVSPDKLDAVLADLRARGYPIEREAVA
jgi:hypothetical protein